MPRVTLRMIAREAGVSLMTVSLALRDKAGVAPERRREIKALAKRLGYRPDPVATELMAQVYAQRRRKGVEVIAYLNTFRDPSLMREYATFREFIAGATECAAEYGYRVEEFQVHGRGMNGRRLARILQTRGVRGLLVGPRWINEPDIDFDWAPFCSVVVGETIYSPKLDRVCNDHTHDMAVALRELHRRGYRRIAVYLGEHYEDVRDFSYLLGVEVFQRENPDAPRCQVWLEETWDPRRFAKLFNAHRPDAVVSHATYPGEWLDEWRRTTGGECGFACLDLPGGSPWSGIDQHSREVGASAMDLLRLQLLRGKRGVRERSQILLVEGTWVQGATTREAAEAARA